MFFYVFDKSSVLFIILLTIPGHMSPGWQCSATCCLDNTTEDHLGYETFPYLSYSPDHSPTESFYQASGHCFTLNKQTKKSHSKEEVETAFKDF